MDVSIIIVNYHTSSLINDCLQSIEQHTYDLTFEIIIVDNNSEDLTKTITKGGIENIKYLQLKENIGFGRANNEALPLCNGRNILFLNPDTLLLNNAIKILSDYLDSHPKCGACGGNLFNRDLQPIHSYNGWRPGIIEAFNNLSNQRLAKLFFKNNYSHNFTEKEVEVGYITGADLMVPRKVLDMIEGYHNSYFMYYEDTDINYRIKKIGYKVVSVPKAKIIHLVGQSFNDEEKIYKRDEMFQKGLAIYLNQNLSYLHKYMAFLSYLTYYNYIIIRAKSNTTIKHRMKLKKKHLKKYFFHNS